jgi:hypothetical protein
MQIQLSSEVGQLKSELEQLKLEKERENSSFQDQINELELELDNLRRQNVIYGILLDLNC